MQQTSKLFMFMVAICLTMAQVLSLSLMTNQKSFSEAYGLYCRWDCLNYARIAAEGYPETINVAPVKYAFFPGFPMAIRAVMSVTGLDQNTAAVVTSQIFTTGFWYYLLLLSALAGSLALSFLVVGLVLSYPYAFYLIVGYTESMFLMCLLGLIYWSIQGGRKGLLIAAVLGFVMTSTRIVGLVLVVLPMLIVILQRFSLLSGNLYKTLKLLAPSLMVGFVASLGTLSFFLFCDLMYGQWNAYMLGQKAGWNVNPSFLFFLDAKNYTLFFPAIEHDFEFNTISVPVFLIYLIVVVLCELYQYRKFGNQALQTRLIFYGAGLGLFVFSAAGLVNSGYQSMMRYLFCTYVLMWLAFVPTIKHLYERYYMFKILSVFLVSLVLYGQALIQGYMAFRYVRGWWVS